MRDWIGDATKLFKGKIVEKIEYTTTRDLKSLGWNKSTPMIIFTDGTYILASCDDEGNEGGVFFTPFDDMPVIPSNGNLQPGQRVTPT